MNDFIITKIDLYCDLVQKGKPCACEAIQERYFEEVDKRIKNLFGLKTYVEDLAPEWKTIWIYRYEFMLEIIKLLPEEPKTTFEHWVLGKAFGYSDEAIKNFLETKL
jgi:hypothetical protein